MKIFRIRSRKVMISRFLYALNTNGYLLLGKGQDIDELSPWFAMWNNQYMVFQKQKNVSGFLKNAVAEKENVTIASIVNEILAASMPSCIIVDSKYEILYTGANAGRYMQFRSGEFIRNLFHNLDNELGSFLNIVIKNLNNKGGEGKTSVSIKTIAEFPEGLCVYVQGKKVMKQLFYLIWFEELKGKAGANFENAEFRKEKEKLEHELTVSQANLSESLKELESVKKRYALVNEKLQRTNEELVVINEELEVANRELAATNRKLTRVNKELQKKLNQMPQFTNGDEVVNIYSLLNMELIYINENFQITKMTRGIPDITNIRYQDMNREIGNLILIDDYIQWQDDLKAAKEGKKVFRIVENGWNKKYAIEILTSHLEKQEDYPAYVVVIYEI